MARSGVTFVRGYHWFTTVPDYVARDGLMQRFAVVQDSYRPDKPIEGMYFDEPLWRRLLAFAAHHAPGATITIEETENGPEIPVALFFAAWDAKAPEDRNPPAIIVREDGKRILAIVPEYWFAVGGPSPYHDSYTYSLYAAEDLGDRVRRFLAEAPEASGWELSGEVHVGDPAPTVGFAKLMWRRVLWKFGMH